MGRDIGRYSDPVEQISRRRFVDEIVAVTRDRQATTHLYVMLREGGAIGVQWEQPGLDHLREFRVVDPDGPVCPHCLIIETVVRLAPVLPLDMLRTAVPGCSTSGSCVPGCCRARVRPAVGES